MRLTDLFKIDGAPMVPPNADMAFSFEDLDSADSGRDEGGYMHRIVVRHMVGSWAFEYSSLTQEEYAYMESLFAGKADFEFTYPSQTDSNTPATTRAYRSKYGVVWHSAKDNTFRSYKFNIIEC